MSAYLHAALAHAQRGWRVFPLWPDTKTAALTNWEHAATTDPERIRRWWSVRAYNIGIAVGPAGLFVIDLDALKPAPPHSVGGAATSATTATTQLNPVAACSPGADASATTQVSAVAGWTAVASTSATSHGRDTLTALCASHHQPVPGATYIVATPSRGWHLYFQQPQGPGLRNTKGGTARSLGPLVDTRGHGGYVVAAGSILAGRPYRVVRNLPPAPLPDWLTNLLRTLDSAARGPTHCRAVPLLTVGARRRNYLNAAIAREVDHVRRAPAGQGNAALWSAAVALGQLVAGGELDAAHIAYVLEQAAIAGGRRSPAEARATIASGLHRGAQRPRTVTA